MTIRTEAELLGLFADNVTGAVSEQDARDFIETCFHAALRHYTESGADPAHVPGLTYYKGGTLNFMRDVDGVIANLPEEVHVAKAYNRTGTTLTNGTIVYVSGEFGNSPKFDRASWADATAYRSLAVVTADIEDGAQGYATVIGMVGSLDTHDWPSGTELYLGANGAFTTVQANDGKAKVFIGTVMAQHTTQGLVWVQPRAHRPTMISMSLGEYSPSSPSSSYSDLDVQASANPSKAVANPDDYPGGGDIYVRLLVASSNGEACSFELWNETAGSQVELVAGGGATIEGVTHTSLAWYELGPLALSSGVAEYHVRAKYDALPAVPRLADSRIVVR